MLSLTNKEWIEPDFITDEIKSNLSEFHPIVQQILFNRGLTSLDEIQEFFGLDGIVHDPYLLKDLSIAIERISQAIHKTEKIIIFGDFDVDGITATSLLTEALHELGGNVEAYIPDRFDEGYGLNPEAIRKIINMGTKLIITVDCGIRSPEEVNLAQKNGVDVILTDHHLPGDQVPDAYAVVCPKQKGDQYPNKNIAGVGVAYKLITALFFEYEKTILEIENYLDLVALGTVADVVPLIGENRTFVKKGLKIIQASKRYGIKALIRESGIYDPSLVSSQDIGFRLGPRLNAAGRLDSAMLGWKLLTSKNEKDASALASILNTLNLERQDKTQEALERSLESSINEDDSFIFLYDTSFHEGIVGLVASKLLDLYYRPTIIGTEHDDSVRCSCRSIPEFNITAALDDCADLLSQYGGHALAAGFTISKKNIPEFIDRIREITKQQYDLVGLHPKLQLDACANLEELNPQIIGELKKFEPTGEKNKQPIFMSRGVSIRKMRTVGREGKHLKLLVSDGKYVFDAIAFQFGYLMNNLPGVVDLAFHYQINNYNGGLQLLVRDIRSSSI